MPALTLFMENKLDAFIALVSMLLLIAREHWGSKISLPSKPAYKWIFYQVLVLVILFFGKFDAALGFIYFQF